MVLHSMSVLNQESTCTAGDVHVLHRLSLAQATRKRR